MSSTRRISKSPFHKIKSSRIPFFSMTNKHKNLKIIHSHYCQGTSVQIAAILLFVAISYKIPKLYEYFLSTRHKKDEEPISSNYGETTYTDRISYWWKFLNKNFRNLFSEDEDPIQNEESEYEDNDFNDFNNFSNNGEKECQRETKYSNISKSNNKDNKNNEIIKDPYISNLDNKKNNITKDPHISKLDNRLTNEIKEINEEIKKINHNYSNRSFYSHNGTKRSNSSECMDLNTFHRTNSIYISPYEHHMNYSDQALKLSTLLKKKHDSEVEVVKCLTKALVIQGNREVLVKNVIREVEVLRNRMDRDFRQ